MLLEREKLLDALASHLEDAREAHGSMVLIAGEAGAGKTSLVRGFVEARDSSTLVITGACDPLTTPRPLSPLYDFAADPDSGLTALTDDELDAMGMFQEVLDRLKNTIRPIVMVIEDVHWADEGTLDFLRFIGRRIDDCKAIVICTYRDDEVGSDHPLRPVLGQLIPLESTDRLSVPALTLEAIRTLAEGHDVDARELLELTDGNAFYVTEVIASGDAEPQTVQEAVLSRVHRLDGPARRVVEAVSVAPRSLDVNQAARLAGSSPDDVDQALAAGVIGAEGRALVFRHELARSAVESSLPPGRRLGLHLEMLDLLESAHSPDLARLAHHAIQAEEVDKIVEYAPRAGKAAAGRGAHKESVAFYEAALSHSDLIDDDEEAAMRVALANELGTIDRRFEALDHLDLAINHYRAIGDEDRLAATLIPSTNARWVFEDSDRFRVRLAEALAILEARPPTEELARAYLTSAYEYMLARKGRLAATEIEKARSVASAAKTSALDWMLDMLDGTVAVVVGDSSRGIDQLNGVRETASRAGHLEDEVLTLMMLGSGGGEVRRYDVSIPALEACVSHGLAIDQDYLAAYSRSWLARVAFEQGRWDDAIEYARLVERESPHRHGIAVLTALSIQGRVRVRRGDPGGIDLLDEMVELGRSHELQHAWNAICGRAEYHWLNDHPDLGLDELGPAYERALDTTSEWARGEIGFWMWRTGALEGPPDGAAEPFRLQMQGRWRESAQAWEEIGCPYEVALALFDGDETAVSEAHQIFASLGAKPMRDRTSQRLRELGVDRIPRGPTKETRSNPANLTGRQLEILGLVSQGLSNGEIADELYLSKKTVEHHVSAIYSKLGVDTRAKAIARAGSLDI